MPDLQPSRTKVIHDTCISQVCSWNYLGILSEYLKPTGVNCFNGFSLCTFQMTMGHFWMSLILTWASLVTPTFCQSGDGDWGSGFDKESTLMVNNDTSQAVGDEPVRTASNPDWITSESSAPTLLYEAQPDECLVHFSTKTASAQRLKAYKEELAYLQAIQHGNRAVMDNLAQFVDGDLGQHSYKDIIKENIIGIQEEHKNCHETVEKAEEDLKKQLEGEALNALSGMQK